MRFPQQHVLRGSGEAQGPHPNQDGELLQRRRHPLDEVDQGGEGASFGPGPLQRGDGGVVEVFDEVETEGEG